MHQHRFLLGITILVNCTGAVAQRSAPDDIWVRPGSRLTIAEDTIKMPRFMEVGPGGTLFVSVPTDSAVYALRDADRDGYFETKTTFAAPGPSVHGLFWHEGWLWWTQPGEVGRSRDTDGDGRADETVKVLGEDLLTEGGGHWFRSILIHKGRIYTGIGDGGNITDPDTKESERKRQKVWSYALDGSDEKLFASGLRNTEKLVLRPGADEIWGMDHGSDWFGQTLEEKEEKGQPITDLNPPEEMNRLVDGGFYGHPFIVGNRLPRYEYLDRGDIVALAARTIPPEWCAGAHWAANAMEFYDHDAIPGARGDAFVAYHGSWNRSQPAGYCVTRVRFEDGHPWGEQVYVRFITPGSRVLGRPVDVAAAPDGSLLISDDHANRIYRLSDADPPPRRR